jgi:hypothetical protein
LTQIRTLTPQAPPAVAPAGAGMAVPAGAAAPAVGPIAAAPAASPVAPTSRPVLPPDLRQFFVPPVARVPGLTYRPAVLAAAEVRYAQARLKVDETRAVQVLVPLENGPIPFTADRAEVVELPVEFLAQEPVEGAGFAELPAEASQARNYDRWGRELVRWIQANQPITLYESRTRKLSSQVGESERDFRIRLAEHAREARDAQADRVRRKYETRFRSLQDRLLRAEQAAERRRGQSRQAALNTGVAALGGLLGAVMGGNSRGQIGRASTAVRGAGRVSQTRQEAARAAETVEAVRAQIAELEQELAQELAALDDSAVAEEPLEEVAVRPALNAIAIRLAALVWLPWGPDGPAWR